MARAAIAIDPSDGEKGEDDRLRAYAVLADILKARDSEEAEIFKSVVAAVDLSEIADTYRRAGLYSRALELYQESLLLFSDAYCVRFRTAVELESAGRIQEAEAHFEAAYTLMPDQFGRIESHCFGCEGAFQGERAETIAERVFTQMLETRPQLPSLHYLMGYLNMSRNRTADAVANFTQAVELDPLYYNAWKHLLELSEQTGDSSTRLQALEAMLQIAPRRALQHIDDISTSQMAELWATLDTTLPVLPPRAASTYPLRATAELAATTSLDIQQRRHRDQSFQSPGQLLFHESEAAEYLKDSLRD